MFQNDDTITLMTADNYYIANSNNVLTLLAESSNPTPAEILWTVTFNKDQGYLISNNRYYIYGHTDSSAQVTLDTSTGTGAWWAPVETAAAGASAGTVVMVCLGANPGPRYFCANGGANQTILHQEYVPHASSAIRFSIQTT